MNFVQLFDLLNMLYWFGIGTHCIETSTAIITLNPTTCSAALLLHAYPLTLDVWHGNGNGAYDPQNRGTDVALSGRSILHLVCGSILNWWHLYSVREYSSRCVLTSEQFTNTLHKQFSQAIRKHFITAARSFRGIARIRNKSLRKDCAVVKCLRTVHMQRLLVTSM